MQIKIRRNKQKQFILSDEAAVKILDTREQLFEALTEALNAQDKVLDKVLEWAKDDKDTSS